ncbi:MAG: hypothetical protein HRT61_19980 [Ekhidna sp.]|nr:hypothetical protein [Ekhidna sp.]
MSPEGAFETAVGDCIDAIFSAILDGDMTKISELQGIIGKIKEEIPVPE